MAAEHANLTAQWAFRGGHVGFPAGFGFGFPAPPGLEPQVLAWLQARL
ncbi:MAG TPA: hypothetical protein VI700_05720 [Thermoanaerobaculaceae bacterium]|nr:hypothetical protein [Thermoanaerobaculaceae bacterium]